MTQSEHDGDSEGTGNRSQASWQDAPRQLIHQRTNFAWTPRPGSARMQTREQNGDPLFWVTVPSSTLCPCQRVGSARLESEQPVSRRMEVQLRRLGSWESGVTQMFGSCHPLSSLGAERGDHGGVAMEHHQCGLHGLIEREEGGARAHHVVSSHRSLERKRGPREPQKRL